MSHKSIILMLHFNSLHSHAGEFYFTISCSIDREVGLDYNLYDRYNQSRRPLVRW